MSFRSGAFKKYALFEISFSADMALCPRSRQILFSDGRDMTRVIITAAGLNGCSGHISL
jgi:hypothetical protein